MQVTSKSRVCVALLFASGCGGQPSHAESVRQLPVPTTNPKVKSTLISTAGDDPVEHATIYICQWRALDSDHGMIGAWSKIATNGVQSLRAQAFQGSSKLSIEPYSVTDGEARCMQQHGSVDCTRVANCGRVETRSCEGVRGEVYCHEGALARIMHAAGWSTMASFVRLPYAKQGSLWAPTLDAFDSLQLAEAFTANDTRRVRELAETFRTWHILSVDEFTKTQSLMGDLFDIEANGVQLEKGPMVWNSAVFEVGNTYLMAFLLGHELWHAYGKCPFDEQSRVEKDRVIEKLLSAQGDDGCAVDYNEQQADLCATRTVEAIDADHSRQLRAAVARGVDPAITKSIRTAGRRAGLEFAEYLFAAGIAADSGTTVTTTRIRTRRLKFQGWNPGYLPWPVRLYTLAYELKQLELDSKQAIGLCGREYDHWMLGYSDVLKECGRYRGSSRRSVRKQLEAEYESDSVFDCGVPRESISTDGIISSDFAMRGRDELDGED